MIYTFYTAKGHINTKYRSPMCSILDTKRKSNIKISIPHNSKKGVFFGKKFGAFYNHQFKLQGIHREKNKKGHNSVKNENSKKQKILFWPIVITSAGTKNQVSGSSGNGARPGADTQTHTQTDTHTDIPRTDQRLKTYEIFFFFNFYLYLFIGGLIVCFLDIV